MNSSKETSKANRLSFDPVWQKTRQSSLVKLVKAMAFLMTAGLFEETKRERRLDTAGDKCGNLSASENAARQQL